VIGEGCKINERVIVKPNIKIWPEKIIEPFAVIDRNMIWGTKHSNKVFGGNGISGIINVDISPEFATRLGAAYGSQFRIGSKVVVSSTNSNSARMFKHAFISGILSVGVEVYNMSGLLTPIARTAIGFLAVEGGIHIKTDIENENMVRVDFMDSRGAAISRFAERKIENSFFKEDFKRCSAEQISRLNNITDFSNYYMRSINSKVDIPLVKGKNLKVCVFSRSEFVLSIVTSMLTDLGCTATSFLYGSNNDLDHIAGHISNTASDFAAIIDKNGESLILVDKTGEVIKDDLFQAFISLIIFKTVPESTFCLPITGSEVIDKLALKYNGTVKRTKNSSQAIMDEILNNNIGKTPEQFILSFDAIAGLINIIEYICISNTTLSQILSEIPSLFMIKKSIHCPWELKGTVMRTIINEQKGKKIELLDGIKLYSNQGWVLIMPDADKPVFKIISESSSSLESEALCNKYYNQLERIIGNN
ncbi:MAG: phosphohexomutase domain-containing protein, partial [Ruminiclostridium sp.]